MHGRPQIPLLYTAGPFPQSIRLKLRHLITAARKRQSCDEEKRVIKNMARNRLKKIYSVLPKIPYLSLNKRKTGTHWNFWKTELRL